MTEDLVLFSKLIWASEPKVMPEPFSSLIQRPQSMPWVGVHVIFSPQHFSQLLDPLLHVVYVASE
jgi:hypothetical protein